jgi:hypothetical protein
MDAAVNGYLSIAGDSKDSVRALSGGTELRRQRSIVFVGEFRNRSETLVHRAPLSVAVLLRLHVLKAGVLAYEAGGRVMSEPKHKAVE